MENKILERINSPRDLKKLSSSELAQLAQEIRKLIIDVVSKTGGHLASNMGTVELTLALHYVFDFKKDRIVWDVGHQTYTHKIITGRKEKFPTLRQYGGISGFPRREESHYDHFNTGHSSTSISAALGMAAARDYKKETHHVVAVIGDGSMTAGLALEGLNQAGYLKKNLIVILNDNEMSISPNVGAISNYLHQIITGQVYNKLKEDIKTLLNFIPVFGEQMIRFAHSLEEAVKRIFVPGMLFEELGFKYMGPVKGHNITQLIEVLNNVKEIEGPVLLHITTRKGKGYSPAEKNPTIFHGASPFIIKDGTFVKKKGIPPSYTRVFGETIIKLATKDEKIVCITAAMPEGTGLTKFAERFPDRFFDVGIAEQHGITFAAGLSCEGLKPVAAIYSTFLQRAVDEVLHDLCLMDLPVTIAMDRAGIVGDDGPTHHGLYDLSYLRSLPNIIIMAPKDENELQHILYTAIETPHPVALRYPRGQGVGVPLDSEFRLIPLARGELLREGNDLAIFAIGNMVYPSLKAAERLSKEGIEATVVNARFVKPIDKELITELAKKVPLVVTVEENSLFGGFGSSVCELLADNNIVYTNILRIGIPDEIIPHGSQRILRHRLGLDAEGIYSRISKFLKGIEKNK
jgi:1-deoxy-D-xylulose-5-phosphate synthase